MSIKLKILIFAILSIAGAILVNSCFNPFAPTQAESKFLAPILDQSDPDDSIAAANVLANFKYAYEHNDIDVYENCLDDDFVFIYTDQDRYGEIEIVEIPRDGISGDIYRTRRLFEIFDEIRLDTWVPIDRTQEPETYSEHPGEIWEIWYFSFHLSLRDITGNYNYARFEANGWAKFKLRRSSGGVMRIRVWEDQSISN
ncbi:MAG: hypothetical protein J7K40_13565 [candidate division Zixibacteria bacterium]|nr:hypothetical protein [candidate division Zixibacteria bacterium]